MPWFIYEANIAHYKQRIARETDPETLKTLWSLLAEEEAKLARYKAQQPKKEQKRE